MTQGPCPGEEALLRLVGGGAPPREAQEVAEHVSSCGACSERVEALARDLALRRRGPLPPRAGARREEPGASNRWPMFAGLAAGIALGAYLLARGDREPTVLPAPAPARPAALDVRAFARIGGRLDEVRDRAALQPGDRLRLAVEAGGAGFLVVVGVSDDGQVRWIFPSAGGSRRLRAGQREFLPVTVAVQRGDPPRRLFAVFSAAPLPPEAIRAASATATSGGVRPARLRRLPLPGTRQWTLLLPAPGAGAP